MDTSSTTGDDDAVPAYVALLRAINVGGRYYKMADLRGHLTDSGLQDVETHIRTGNVRFRTPRRSAARVEQHVEAVLGEHCGFDVPTIVFTPAELREVYDDAQALAFQGGAEGVRRYVAFFKAGAAPTGETAERIAAWDAPGESAVVLGRAAHIWIDTPMHEARFFNAFRKALAPGTNRDIKVVATLAEKWGG